MVNITTRKNSRNDSSRCPSCHPTQCQSTEGKANMESQTCQNTDQFFLQPVHIRPPSQARLKLPPHVVTAICIQRSTGFYDPGSSRVLLTLV